MAILGFHELDHSHKSSEILAKMIFDRAGRDVTQIVKEYLDAIKAGGLDIDWVINRYAAFQRNYGPFTDTEHTGTVLEEGGWEHPEDFPEPEKPPFTGGILKPESIENIRSALVSANKIGSTPQKPLRGITRIIQAFRDGESLSEPTNKSTSNQSSI